MRVSVAIVMAVAVSGCASRSDTIRASYVSPTMYQSYSCHQLAEEASRVSSRAAQAAGAQDRAATGDAVAMGVALVVFWPALFFIQGDNGNAEEVARLRGEMEAIEQANIRKNCGIEFRSS